jgi:hypothetical protein
MEIQANPGASLKRNVMAHEARHPNRAPTDSTPRGSLGINDQMVDDPPGVALGDYRRLRAGVLLICLDCVQQRTFPLETIIDRLKARGGSGEETGIRRVARYVREPCPRCGGRRFETRPAFAQDQRDGTWKL